MAIKLDRSSTGIVVCCDQCPWWSAFRFTQDEAWATACRHEEDHHPEDMHQRTARRVREHRSRAHAMAGM